MKRWRRKCRNEVPSGRPRAAHAPALEALESRWLLDAVWDGSGVDGDHIHIALTGEGTMEVQQPILQSGNPDILKITLLDTEGCGTVLAITVTKAPTGDGLARIGRITGGANCGIHFLNAPKVNIVGTATVNPNHPDGDGSGYGIDLQGLLRQTVINNIENGMDIWAKQEGVWYPDCVASNLAIGDLSAGSSITLGSRVEKFTANSWAPGGVFDSKSIDKMTIKGNFGAGIATLRGVGPVTVGGTVGGDVANPAIWSIPRGLGAVKMGGSNAYWSVDVGGNIASLTTTAGNLNYDTIQATSAGPMTAKKDMIGTSLSLTQRVDPSNPKVAALGAVTVGGAVGGLWTIGGHAGAIKAGSSNLNWNVAIEGNVPALTIGANMYFAAWSANSLGSLTVGSNMGDGVHAGTMRLWQAPGAKLALGKVTVAKWMQDVQIRSVGNIGTVTAMAMDTVNIFAGVQDAVNGLLSAVTPQSAGSYLVGADASIAGITIKGIPAGPGVQPWMRHSMMDTTIIAARTGPMTLFGPLDGGGGDVAAKTIGTIKITKPDGTKFSWPQPPGYWPAEADDLVTVVRLT